MFFGGPIIKWGMAKKKNKKPKRIIWHTYCIFPNNPYIRLWHNGTACPTVFCVQSRRIERKKKERKEGLGDGIEDEAHIWVIGNDRPGIIHPDNRRSKKMEGGGGPET